MFFTFPYQSKKMTSASANYAEASFPCAYFSYDNLMTLLLDAILMASILICLISFPPVGNLFAVLPICVSLILVVVRFMSKELHRPKRRALF